MRGLSLIYGVIIGSSLGRLLLAGQTLGFAATQPVGAGPPAEVAETVAAPGTVPAVSMPLGLPETQPTAPAASFATTKAARSRV